MFWFRIGFVTDKQAEPDKVYIPICNYNGEIGVNIKTYNEHYCDPVAFQPTFNEYGMCYTFNNRKQGMDEFFETHSATEAATNRGYSQARTKNKTGAVTHPEDDNRKILKVILNRSLKKIFILTNIIKLNYVL